MEFFFKKKAYNKISDAILWKILFEKKFFNIVFIILENKKFFENIIFVDDIQSSERKSLLGLRFAIEIFILKFCITGVKRIILSRLKILYFSACFLEKN